MPAGPSRPDAADPAASAADALRTRAEASARSGPVQPSGSLTAEETQRLLHELRVHQIELEMQNEELRRAQLENETGLARYTELYEFASVGYFNLTADGTIRLVNLTGARLIGLDRTALLGRNFKLFVAIEQRFAFQDFFRRVFATEEHQTCELTLVPASRPPLHARLEATASAAGAECLIALIDLTERTRAEEALRASEERLRLALDAAHLGIFDWDLAQDHITWSRRREELWGFQPGQFDGSYDTFARRVHPEDLPSINAEVARCITARENFSREFRVVWPDGSVHWIAGRGEFTFGNSGQPVRMRGAVMETTARKQAEAALRASEAGAQDAAHRQSAILNALPAHIALIDPEGVILSINEAWRRFATANLLRSEDFSLGQNYLSVCEQATGDCSNEAYEVLLGMREVLAGRKPEFTIEYPCHSLTEKRWFRLVVTPVHEDRREGAVVMHFNITERKLAEVALRELAQRLLHAEDEERRRIAKELHDSTAQDLVAVLLNLATVRDALPALAPGPAQILEDSVALLENSANDIRTLSYALHPPRLDEMGLAGGLTEYAAGLGRRANVRIRVEVAADFGRLPEDLEIALFRVAQESLGNVLRHSESDTATIRLARYDASIVLEVQDFGRGLPPELATQTGARGVGIIGMRERLQYLGGRLEIESGSGGTKVRAVLPWKGETP